VNSLILFSLILVPLLLNGCATQADIQEVRQERDALRTQAADNKAMLDSLRREIEQVRGEVEEVRYRLDQVAKERGGTSPRVKLLEDRIAVLEKQVRMRPVEMVPPPVEGEPPLSSPGDIPLGSQPGQPAPSSFPPRTGLPPPETQPMSQEEIALAREPVEVQDEYRLGRGAMQERQYDRAIQLFRGFQRKYPDSSLADDAQYWIGEIYFEQRDYNRAILEFNDVLKYRRGDKVPAALLRQAQAFLEIGDKTDARLILQKLINDHPKSEQAQEARVQLQTLSR
jgi:tol-pal system protein YbgF